MQFEQIWHCKFWIELYVVVSVWVAVWWAGGGRNFAS